MTDSAKKKLKRQSVIGTAVTMILGLAAGGIGGAAIIFRGIEPFDTKESTVGTFLIRFGLYMFLFLVAWLLGVVIHEGGHLVFGLLSGYQFRSFRVFSVMLVKTEKGLEWKRFNLAGTGGQCLMAPPDFADGKMPYKLYNYGGALMNLIAAALFYLFFRASSGIGAWAVFCILTVVMNVYMAIGNGLPLLTRMIPNDGYNATHLGKDPAALRAFWSQLRINELTQAKGMRLRDLDPALFETAEGADLTNALTVSQLVNAENRTMDAHDFATAKALIATLTSPDTALNGLYRSLVTLDRVFLDILEKGAETDVSVLETKEMKNFRKAMKGFPTVIRTEYAVAKAVKGDDAEAAKCLERFDALEKTYPTKADLDSERDLMAILQ